VLPTWRLLGLLLFGAPIGAFGGPLSLLAVVLVLLALGAAGLDWFLAADGRRIAARRVLEAETLSLGAWNPVRLELDNASGRVQHVQLREVVPPEFRLDRPVPLFQVRLAAAERTMVLFHVQPPRRGDARFGDLYLRARGPLGLVWRDRRCVGTARSVRIYPNLRELRRFDLLVRRGLEAEPVGRPVRQPGQASEFERVREYLPDDDVRRINWKATARRGQPMVNQFEAERGQNLVVLLDAGRGMAALADAPTAADDPAAGPGLTKLDYALNAGLLLAYVASARGDRVALLAYADDVRTFTPPARGRRALLGLLQALYNLRAEPVEPDHGRAFEFLARRNLRRSLVVLFTDLADRESSATLAAHLVRAARQHLVVCVTLADPNVRRPALQRANDGPSLYEKMVAQRLLDERAAVLAELAGHGILTVDTDANALHPRLIQTYLDLKRAGRV
jgi:uncharacterized protein (DUF58 family)